MDFKNVKFSDVSLATFEQFKSVKAIVFDFDGTLYKNIDWTGFYEYFIKGVKKLFPQLTQKQFENLLKKHNVFEDSVMEDMARLFKAEKNSTKQYVEYLKTVKFDGDFSKAKAFPEDILEVLSKKNKLYILSNSSGENIKYLSPKIGLNLSYFEDILSNSFDIDDMSKTKKLKELLSYINIPAKQILMVGDSVQHDLIPAKNLGMQTLLMED